MSQFVTGSAFLAPHQNSQPMSTVAATLTETTETPTSPGTNIDYKVSTVNTVTMGKFSPEHDWQRTPIPLIRTPHHMTRSRDPYTLAASEMAIVHNCLIRALNSIYIQAPHVPISQYANLIKYCIAAHEGLIAHQRGKEQVFLPEIEKLTGESLKGLMGGNGKFQAGLAAWGNWLNSIETRKNNFSPDMCRTLMDDFLLLVATHFDHEIATLLSLSRFGNKLDLEVLRKKEWEKLVGGLSKTKTLPVILLNHDEAFEGGWHTFPPGPALSRMFLRNCGRKTSEVWVFSTCGFDGQPRRGGLRFMGKGEGDALDGFR